MINVQTAEDIITLVTFFLAYLFSVTIAGFFRAWVADKMGDDTSVKAGLLTLNPIAHIDPFGLVFLIIFRFGWGRTVPINPHNIHGRARIIKLIVAYFSNTFAYLGIAIIGLFGLLAAFGGRIFAVIIPVLNYDTLSHALIARLFPTSASWLLSIGLIGIAAIYLNAMLAIISTIVSLCGLSIMLFLEKYPHYWKNASLLFMLIPLLFILFFGLFLRPLIMYVIMYTGTFLAYLFGVITL